MYKVSKISKLLIQQLMSNKVTEFLAFHVDVQIYLNRNARDWPGISYLILSYQAINLPHISPC
jgi:hypothetical protein